MHRLEEELGIKTIPEMLFITSHLTMKRGEEFQLSFSGRGVLDACAAFQRLQACPPASPSAAASSSSSSLAHVKVSASEEWLRTRPTTVDAHEVGEEYSNWTFSSQYFGTCSNVDYACSFQYILIAYDMHLLYVSGRID